MPNKVNQLNFHTYVSVMKKSRNDHVFYIAIKALYRPTNEIVGV